MSEQSGPGWEAIGGGWVLYRPDYFSTTYKITEEQHRRIQLLRNLELASAFLTLIPLVLLAVLWVNGVVTWLGPLIGLVAYAGFNTVVSTAARRAVREVKLRAARANREIMLPSPTRELKSALRFLIKSPIEHAKLKFLVVGSILLGFGFVALLLSAVMHGDATLWIVTITFGAAAWWAFAKRASK